MKRIYLQVFIGIILCIAKTVNSAVVPDTIDVNVCEGESVILRAAYPGFYDWEDGSDADTLLVTTSVDSLIDLNILATGNELVRNGDFSAGNVNFSTSYTYYAGTPPLYGGQFWVGPNAMTVHGDFRGFDHTAGTGIAPDNFLVVNGASTPNTMVWSQTITVQPNTNYAFSCYTTNVVSYTPAQLQFSINGTQIGAVFSTNNYQVFDQFYNVWNSGSSTSAVITILNQNTAGGGNDFGIDDISFTPISDRKIVYRVTVHDKPVVDIAPDASICDNESILLDATSMLPSISYLWQDGSTLPTFLARNSGKHKVIVSNNFCSNADSMMLTVNSAPNLDLGNDTSICTGSTITLNVFSAGSTYLWHDGNTSSSRTVGVAGEYRVTVTKNGCFANDAISVSTGNLSVDLGADIHLCSGENHSFILNEPGYSYTWNESYLGNSFIVNSAQEVRVDAFDGVCHGYDTIIVIEEQVPDISLGNDTTLCQGQTVTYSANGTGGPLGTGYSFIWHDGSTSSQYTVLSSETISVTVSNSYCSDSDAATIDFQAPPVVDLGFDRHICEGESTTFQLANPALTYIWNNSITSTNYISNETEEITMKASDGICTGYDTVQVFLEPKPVLSLGNDTAICAGLTLTYDLSGTGTSYLWHNGNSGPSYTVSSSESVSVTVSNSYCSASDNVLVTISSTPSIDLGDDIHICPGETASFSLSGGLIYTWNNSWVGSSYATAVSEQITVTGSNGTCAGYDTVNVFLESNPVFSLGNDINLCEGETHTFNLSGAGTNFLWNDGSTGSSYSVSSSELVSVTVSNSYCSASDNALVSITSTPSIDLGDDVHICPGETASFSLSGGLIYTWNNSWVGLSYATAVSEQITVIGSNSTCTGYDTVNVFLESNPVFSLGNDINLCEGETYTFNLSGAGTNFLWNDGSTGSSYSVSSSELVNVTVSNNYCSASDNALVSVTSTPSIDLGDDVHICAGETASFSLAGGLAYTWNNSSVGSTYTTAVSEQITLIGTNGLCTGYDTVEVFVHNLPFVNLGNDTTLCEGETILFDLNGSGSAFTWHNGSHASTYLATNNENISVIVNNEYCTATASVAVSIRHIPTIDLGDDENICEGDNLTIVLPDFYSYVWHDGSTSNTYETTISGTLAVTASNGRCSISDAMQVMVHPLPSISLNNISICDNEIATFNPGSYSSYLWSNGSTNAIFQTSDAEMVEVQVSDGRCFNSAQATVTVNPSPSVSAGADVAACSGETITLTATGNATQYEWSNGQVGSSITVSTADIFTVTATLNGCSASDQVRTSFNAIPSAPLTSEPSHTQCLGSLPVYFNASGSSIQWYSDASLNSRITAGPQYLPQENHAGLYTYYATQTLNGCESAPTQFSLQISEPIPSDIILAGKMGVCENSGEAIYTIQTDLENVSWSVSPAVTISHISETSFQANWRNAGIYSIQISGSDVNGCRNAETYSVKVTEYPVADFSYSEGEREGLFNLIDESIQASLWQDDIAVQVPYTLNWSAEKDGAIIYGSQPYNDRFEPYQMSLGMGDYNVALKVVNEFGCADSTSISVYSQLTSALYVPSAFCPVHNSHGVSHFQPTGMGLEEYEMWVFDPWGNLVWYTDKLNSNGRPTESWDGRSEGLLLKQGTYIWKARIKTSDNTGWGDNQTSDGSYVQFGAIELLW